MSNQTVCSPDTLSTLAAKLELLRNTDRLVLRPIGAAASGESVLAPFERAPELLELLRPRVERMVEEGSAGGRIAAALLVGQLDRAAGRAALQSLRGLDGNVTYVLGGDWPAQHPASVVVDNELLLLDAREHWERMRPRYAPITGRDLVVLAMLVLALFASIALCITQ
jgi:hypothetical protein